MKRLQQAEALFDEGLITKREFSRMKANALAMIAEKRAVQQFLSSPVTVPDESLSGGFGKNFFGVKQHTHVEGGSISSPIRLCFAFTDIGAELEIYRCGISRYVRATIVDWDPDDGLHRVKYSKKTTSTWVALWKHKYNVLKSGTGTKKLSDSARIRRRGRRLMTKRMKNSLNLEMRELYGGEELPGDEDDYFEPSIERPFRSVLKKEKKGKRERKR